jgi:hypothetical protein
MRTYIYTSKPILVNYILAIEVRALQPRGDMWKEGRHLPAEDGFLCCDRIRQCQSLRVTAYSSNAPCGGYCCTGEVEDVYPAGCRLRFRRARGSADDALAVDEPARSAATCGQCTAHVKRKHECSSRSPMYRCNGRCKMRIWRTPVCPWDVQRGGCRIDVAVLCSLGAVFCEHPLVHEQVQ